MQDLEERLSLDMAAAAAGVKDVKVLTIHGTGESNIRCFSNTGSLLSPPALSYTPACPLALTNMAATHCLCSHPSVP